MVEVFRIFAGKSYEVRVLSFFTDYFGKLQFQLHNVDSTQLESVVDKLEATRRASGKVILIGNGGSAAMAAHVSVDLTKAARIRAITFNEANLLTCFANDYGYEHWVSEALKAYADPQDLVILISSSGKSPNIVNGAKEARSQGLGIVTLSGFSHDNPLRSLGDVNLWCDSVSYNIVEMTHHVWLLAAVDKVVAELKSRGS